jgi:hypothetical protein
MGWKSNRIENFRKKNFGLASGIGIDARNAGWFCAQRRPGHGFGWLMEMYRDSANIPDILMIVDDDTAVVRMPPYFVFIEPLNFECSCIDSYCYVWLYFSSSI